MFSRPSVAETPEPARMLLTALCGGSRRRPQTVRHRIRNQGRRGVVSRQKASANFTEFDEFLDGRLVTSPPAAIFRSGTDDAPILPALFRDGRTRKKEERYEISSDCGSCSTRFVCDTGLCRYIDLPQQHLHR